MPAPYMETIKQEVMRLTREAGEAPASEIDDRRGRNVSQNLITKLDILTPAELTRREQLRWRIDGVLPFGGVVLLYGKKDTLKTFTALSMALAVASGTRWFGRAVKQGLVVYIAAEGGNGLARRVQAWERGNVCGAPDEFRAILNPVNFRQEKAVLNLVANMNNQMFRSPSLIVVDTVARSFGGGDLKEDMPQFVTGVDLLREETGADVLLVHHTPRVGTNPAGGYALEAAADTVIYISRSGTRLQSPVTLTCHHQKDAEPFNPITLAPSQVGLGVDREGRPVTSLTLNATAGHESSAHEHVSKDTPLDPVLRRLKQRTFGTQEVVDESAKVHDKPWSKKTAERRIKDWRGQGLLEPCGTELVGKTQRNLWRLAAKGGEKE